MISVLAFFSALALGLALLPVLIQNAVRLGIMDLPAPRKVHVNPTPRVGGIAIVIATVVPCLVLLPLDAAAVGLYLAVAVLFVLGVVDDRHQVGPWTKLVGQIVAGCLAVYVGDVYVATLPFMDTAPLAAEISRPFSVFALVGMMNAVNVTDGLDGLAGGLTLLTLTGILIFALGSSDNFTLTLALATVGAVVAFLRFNTRPAIVFMGDTGSQFLGFITGFLAVYLTQRVNSALSPALPLLLLGVPIIDIFAAVVQRVHAGIGPFVASRHHIHHRLLDSGMDAQQAVITIYVMQAFLVTCAILFPYEADWLVILVFLGVGGLVLGSIWWRLRPGATLSRPEHTWQTGKLITRLRQSSLLTVVPFRIIFLGAIIYLIFTAVVARSVPPDIAIAATVLAVFLATHLLLSGASLALSPQIVVFAAAAFAAYLGTSQAPLHEFFARTEIAFFVIMLIAIGLSVRFSTTMDFRTTPLDYLVGFLMLAAGFVSQNGYLPERTASIVIKAVILFYTTELIMAQTVQCRKWLYAAVFGSLTIMALRGFLSI